MRSWFDSKICGHSRLMERYPNWKDVLNWVTHDSTQTLRGCFETHSQLKPYLSREDEYCWLL
jgi:hypothetical protein